MRGNGVGDYGLLCHVRVLCAVQRPQRRVAPLRLLKDWPRVRERGTHREKETERGDGGVLEGREKEREGVRERERESTRARERERERGGGGRERRGARAWARARAHTHTHQSFISELATTTPTKKNSN